ncbi:MAG: ABC transporter ATP-binding protein [Flavobacteriaceae bacterium]
MSAGAPIKPVEKPPLLELSGIRKAYPSVVANDGIDLTVRAGEIHALLGENGAGKSTLMKIIFGVVRPDAGEIRWEGVPQTITSPAHARQLGIGMVFQHFSLFETLTAAENIALGMPGKPQIASIIRQVQSVSERYGLPIDPRRHVHSMSVGERQRVEIVRSLLQNPRLLIMDEPTSVLTPQAVEKLFDTLRRLASEGVSIVYISHKLDEIKALCERATVLRGGKVTGVCDPRRETPKSMAEMMIGEELPVCQHPPAKVGNEPLLSVSKLSTKSDEPFGTDLSEVSLDVHGGEVVGIAGISGNGQAELLAALSGEHPLRERDAVRICGKPAGALGPLQRRRLGLGFVPEERLGRGLVPELKLSENALLTAHAMGMVRSGLVRFAEAGSFAQRCIDGFRVRCGGPEAEARSLSGGNLQKFIVGREILQRPKVLVVAQPTWGVDVGAAAFIRQTLIDLRNSGTAILVISEELDELFEICDRIAVIAKGRLSPCRRAKETDVKEIGLLMTGLWTQEGGVGQARGEEAGHANQA